jgi:hypothetical protein
MTTVFLTLLLVLGIATQSLAEWTEVHAQASGNPRLYADYHTIQGTSVWILMDYNTPAYSGSLSTKIQLEFDCPGDRRRITVQPHDCSFLNTCVKNCHVFNVGPS